MWKQKIPTDCLDVLTTSSILSTGEFEIFRLAYASWYGRDAEEELLERHFVRYMFRDQVPFWVRAFTRRVLSQEQDGQLDPGQFGIERPSKQGRDPSRGVLYVFGIGLALVTLLMLAEAAAPLLGIDDCWFPPCY